MVDQKLGLQRQERRHSPPPGSAIAGGGGVTTSPLNGATSMGDIGTLICTMMEAQSAAQVAMLVASNVNMIAFHTATVQALAAKNGDKDSKLTVPLKKQN